MAAPAAAAVVRARAIVGYLVSSPATTAARGAYVEAVATSLLAALDDDSVLIPLRAGASPCANPSASIASSPRDQAHASGTMGAPATVVRVVRARAVVATPTEALVSRYTRGGIVVDGVVTSRPLLAAPGDDWVIIAPRPRALPPGPHAYSSVVAAQPDAGDGGGHLIDYQGGSGSRVAAEASAAEIQAPTAEEASEEGFLPRPWTRFYRTAPRPLHLTFAATEEAPEVEIPPYSRARSATATASPSLATGMGQHRPRLLFTRTGYGHHLIRPAASPKTGLPAVLTRGLRSYAKPPQRDMELRPFQLRQRRGWCWTPWQPNKPKPLETKPKGLEDIIRLLKEVKLSKGEQAELKEFFLRMFYSENEDPQGSQVKLDLVLHRQVLTNRMLKDLAAKVDKKPKKWLTVTIRGRKVELTTWIAAAVQSLISSLF